MTRAWALLVSALLLGTGACGPRRETAMGRGPDQYKVLLQTTKGDVVILVHRDWSPLGADHFYELTKMGFYNNNYFFRALKGYLVQWGINGSPKLNGKWTSYPIRSDAPKVSNKMGTVVFVTLGPNSRWTQVFINLDDNSPSLDPQGFTPFGEVTQGLENVQNIFMDYGDAPPRGSGPDPMIISNKGNKYLQKSFPELDRIKKAEVVP